jgi:peptidoglycan/LPS O-acetylase OafA/YrhL
LIGIKRNPSFWTFPERGVASGRPGLNLSVHGARGLFSALVFAFHVANSGLATFYPADHWLAVYLFGSLKYGVELFFGISGFVIVGALARAPSLRAFAWDRATRIYPLLWTTLLVITALSLATRHWVPPFTDWLLNFLAPPPVYDLPQVNPAAWSLGYEVSFYALAALCWYAGRRGWRWRPVAGIVGALLIAVLPRALLMPAGVLIAAGMLDCRLLVRLAAVPGFWLVAFLLLWRCTELRVPAGDIMLLTPFRMGVAAWAAVLPLMLATGAAGWIALLGIARERGLLCALLRSPPFQWLGTISYSFYLWHPVVMAPIKAALIASGLAAALGPAAQLVFAVVALLPALVVAHFSQIWIERRLTRWLRRHGPREDRGAAPVTSVVSAHGAESGRS